MARPTKLTPEVIKTVADALYLGVSREMASRYAGISYPSFFCWERDGHELSEKPGKKTAHEKLLISFYKEVDKAEAEAVVKWQQVVDKAAERDWQASLHMLRLRDKKNYVAPAAIDLTSAGNEIRPVVNIYIPSNGRENGNPDSGSDNN